jgi:hypothetical protein
VLLHQRQRLYFTSHDSRLLSTKNPAAALKVLQLDFTSLIRPYVSDSQTSASRLSPIRDLQLPSYLDAPRVFIRGVNPLTMIAVCLPFGDWLFKTTLYPTSPLTEYCHSLDEWLPPSQHLQLPK